MAGRHSKRGRYVPQRPQTIATVQLVDVTGTGYFR